MKKNISIAIVTLLVLGFSYVIIKELTCSPLKEKDFKNLFPYYEGKAKRKCYIDYIDFSLYGELFDISVYELDEVSLDFQYPYFEAALEGITLLDDKYSFSKWRNCPLDSLTSIKYNDVLTMEDFSKKKCSHSFNTELANPNNYYSYLYINELEHYFYLYCPENDCLYYLRRRGW